MPKEPEAVEDLPSPGGSPSGGGGGGSMMPILAIVILIPIITIGLAEFYIFPKVTEIVAATGGHDAAEGEHGGSGGDGAHAVERGEAVAHYEFNDIVSNLRGSMNSRYIKVSFTVESKVIDFEHYMDVNRAKMLDATISVLSGLTMQDLDEPGIKNIVRSDLLNSFGSALHANVIDNLYFSEFVVQ